MDNSTAVKPTSADVDQTGLEDLWVIDDVCHYLKVKSSTIRYWCHVNAISHHKVGSLVRFRKSEIVADFELGRLGKIGMCKRTSK